MSTTHAFFRSLLKVRFGILSFAEREAYITEGAHDGGIDAYYIDTQARLIYFVQSKFRQNVQNFEAKAIEVEELLRMDIDRILDGDTSDSKGAPYNSKIRALMAKIRSLDNISRYSYQVIILANVKELAREKLNRLTGDFPAQVFDHARCYKELLFPLVAATYYTFGDLHVALNLSNKNAGAKISYTVATKVALLEITVVFVPTIEIAAAMHKFRNAILRYNPRSYLEHEGATVNGEIRRSIEVQETNEFALFNNGITIISDGTFLNEKIGQKDRAQLTLVNPQIINGGQTAYVLSQLFREHAEPNRSAMFGQKEVLVKIITFDTETPLPEQEKLDLIDAISRATNSQTVVSKADRRSNEGDLMKLQERCFDEFGIWLERKRGEFADGVREGYIDPSLIVDRNLFFRAAAIARGEIAMAVKKKLFVTSNFAEYLDAPPDQFDKYNLALRILRRVHQQNGENQSRLGIDMVSKAYVTMLLLSADAQVDADDVLVSTCANFVKHRWAAFLRYLGDKYESTRYWIVADQREGKVFSLHRYFSETNVVSDVRAFFGAGWRQRSDAASI